MTSLNRKTKAQLEEIAKDLDVNIKGSKVKQAIVDKLNEYFAENADKFDKNHEYYEYVAAAKATGDEEEEDDEEDAESFEIDEYDELETDSDDEFDLEPSVLDKVLDYIDNDTLYEVADYIAEKNYELRDYLSDPFTINEFTVVGEFLFLYGHFIKTIALGDSYFVPTVLKEKLPAALLKAPIADVTHLLDPTFWSTVSLWLFVSYVAPKLTSYYVNFTYNFEYDPFIFSLSKLLFGLILFKTEVTGHIIKDELAYQLSFKSLSFDYASKIAEHYLVTSALLLRAYYGNWTLIGGFFTTLVALYANLSFI